MILLIALLGSLFVGCLSLLCYRLSPKVAKIFTCALGACLAWIPVATIVALEATSNARGDSLTKLASFLVIKIPLCGFGLIAVTISAIVASIEANKNPDVNRQGQLTFGLPAGVSFMMLCLFFNESSSLQVGSSHSPDSPPPARSYLSYQPRTSSNNPNGPKPDVTQMQPPAPVAFPQGQQLEVAELEVLARLKAGSPSADGRLFPFYRQLLPGQHHFYTASAQEMNKAAQSGYTNEGQIGYVLGSKELGSIPLFHLFGRNDHFYCTGQQEAIEAIRNYQYGYLDIAGFVFPKQEPGTIPVFRHFNGSTHFYTSNPDESAKIPSSGWKLEGPAYYIRTQ